jgi:enamine deaminase RidA (YjgF/YER057c/UK114 family)
MTDSIQSRLAARNITLPEAAAPAANYLPYVISGSQLFISGQLPMENGALAVTGILGRDVDVATAQRAAELCAINILSQARRHWVAIWSELSGSSSSTGLSPQTRTSPSNTW